MKFSGPADPGFSIPLDLVGFVGCFLTCGMLQRVREHTSLFSASAIFWITAEAEFFCQSKSLQDAFCETRTWLWPPGAWQTLVSPAFSVSLALSMQPNHWLFLVRQMHQSKMSKNRGCNHWPSVSIFPVENHNEHHSVEREGLWMQTRPAVRLQRSEMVGGAGLPGVFSGFWRSEGLKLACLFTTNETELGRQAWILRRARRKIKLQNEKKILNLVGSFLCQIEVTFSKCITIL